VVWVNGERRQTVGSEPRGEVKKVAPLIHKL
jgi:hypothetical protein